MFTDYSPEYLKWLGYAADTSRGGDYDEAWRQRHGYTFTPNDFFVSAVLCDEGGRKRDVIDTNNTKHRIRYLGYITLFHQKTHSHIEFLFLDDGRMFQFADPPPGSDDQRTRDFIPIELAAKALEEAIQT
jgi:hypothetical protein